MDGGGGRGPRGEGSKVKVRRENEGTAEGGRCLTAFHFRLLNDSVFTRLRMLNFDLEGVEIKGRREPPTSSCLV